MRIEKMDVFFRNLRSLLLLFFLANMFVAQAQINPLMEMGISLQQNDVVLDTATIYNRIQSAKEILDGNPDTAIVLFRTTLADSRKINYHNGIALSLLSMGKAYTIKARYEEGMKLWQEGIRYVYLTGSDPKLLAAFYSNIGVLYGIKGEYSESLDILLKALKFAEMVHLNDAGMGVAYNNIATVFLRIPNTPLEKTQYYLERAAFHAVQSKDNKLLAAILANQGTMYEQHKDWSKSKVFFDSALTIAYKNGLIETQYSILLSMGEFYLSNNKTLEGLHSLEAAESLDQRGINPYYKTLTNLRIGEAYSQLKDYDKAKFYVMKADTASRKLGIVSYRYQVYESLSRLYKQTGDYKKSLEYYQLYTAFNDSILKQNTLNYISEMDIKYKSVQKEKEITKNRLTIVNQQNRLTRNNVFIALGFACSVLLAIVLFITIKSAKQRQKLILKEKSIDNLKSMIEGEEKERIRIARELHDGIGGMLAAIKFNFNTLSREATAEENEKLKEIKSMLESTSNEVRMVAYNLVPDILIKFGLKQALQTYYNSLSNEHLNINLQFHGRTALIDKPKELILYRIIQELVQNVIKHARATVIDMLLMEYDNHINLTFEDNGIGFDIDKIKAGLGIQNIRSRVESLQGTMSVVSLENQGTSVHIEFPLEQ